MADESPRPDISVPAAYGNAIRDLKRRYDRLEDISVAAEKLRNAKIDICEDCQKEMEDTKHDENVAVAAIAKALNVQCALVHRTCYGIRTLNAADIARGECVCGAKIIIEEVKE